MSDHRQLVTIGEALESGAACHSATRSSSVGIPGNLELEARGWKRRYLADEHRAREAMELYSSLGFEVRAETLEPSHFGSHCGECSTTVCALYVLVYTRKRPTSGSNEEESE